MHPRSHQLIAAAAVAACGVAVIATSPASAAPLASPTSFVVVQGGTGVAGPPQPPWQRAAPSCRRGPRSGSSSPRPVTTRSTTWPAPPTTSWPPARPARCRRSCPRPPSFRTARSRASGPAPRGATTPPSRSTPTSGTCAPSRPTRRTRSTDGSATSPSACSTPASRPTHPDLAAERRRLAVGRAASARAACRTPARSPGSPTTSDHGTHVAGTIAAARNGVGIVGVAPNVQARLRQGRRRRRLHLPRVRHLRLPVGRRPRHAGHQQQLLHRPVLPVVQGRPRREGGRGRGRARAMKYSAEEGRASTSPRPATQHWDLPSRSSTRAAPNNVRRTSRSATPTTMLRHAGRARQRRDGLCDRPDRREVVLLQLRRGRHRRRRARRRPVRSPAHARQNGRILSDRGQTAARATSRAPRWPARTSAGVVALIRSTRPDAERQAGHHDARA